MQTDGLGLLELGSWVYAIGVAGSSIAKIGVAVDIEKRLRSLQTAHYQKLAILWRTRGNRALEQSLHTRFAQHRLTGEWFDFGEGDPAALISAAVEEIRSGGERGQRKHLVSQHPADDDPDKDNPRFWPNELGCRALTPRECAERGLPGAVWHCSVFHDGYH